MKILVIDDEPQIVKQLKTQLDGLAESVISATSYDTARNILLTQHFDCILCDYALSQEGHKQGLDLMKEIREKGILTPIILLTGRDLDEITPWKALDGGVDDFVKKPYKTQELIARIRAVHRRSSDSESVGGSIITYHDMAIDLNLKKFYADGKETHLRKTPFLLLTKFMRTPEKSVSYSQLIEYLWGESAIYLEQSMNALRVHMHNLKKVLKDAGVPHIDNIHGYGYVLRKNDDE